MRIVYFLVTLVATLALIFTLNSKIGSAPAFGSFLSPQHGFWQNAESVDQKFDVNIADASLKGKVDVYLDDRLVPHIFADNDADAYFVQGYLHAKFRLWQMEFQTMAAAGRVSEVLGGDEKYINYDKRIRRMGMVYAAKNMEKEMLADPRSKEMVEEYTRGVNYYIERLAEKDLPLEYKLLGYKPEKWNTLKCALFVKNMANVLAGAEDDIEHTNAKATFGIRSVGLLYPEVDDSLDPVIAKGTLFTKPLVNAIKPARADSEYVFKNNGGDSLLNPDKPNKANGSNNWVVAGSKTKSGHPILCNDPHLELSLPSIWYEMQVQTPTMNAYGSTFPGGPGVIIGYNDSCAFGFTNAGRDIKDYYEIEFKDDSKKQYKFNGQWADSKIEIETIKVKGKADVLDTVAYTIFGPVMYDKSFGNDDANGKNYAVRWVVHDPSNELLMWWKLDRAKNYADYAEAIKDYVSPAQNMAFACKNGDIALWQQGKFPLRWKDQGNYMMPGFDSTYLWQGWIPQAENPHMVNPARGFVSSANQRSVDATYPYYIPGGYHLYRGIVVNRLLAGMNNITATDMMNMQNNNYNVFAETCKPLLLKNMANANLSSEEAAFLYKFRNWNLQNDAKETGITVFNEWFKALEDTIWLDEFAKTKLALAKPDQSTLIQALLKDSNFVFIDNVATPGKETLAQMVEAAFKKACLVLKQKEADKKLEWGASKDSRVNHLLRLEALSRLHLGIGGGPNTINAMGSSHGPSWKLVVHLDSVTEAYGIYPGGQSGNPGSMFYDNFIDDYTKGKHYKLWMMTRAEATDKKVKAHMVFSKG